MSRTDGYLEAKWPTVGTYPQGPGCRETTRKTTAAGGNLSRRGAKAMGGAATRDAKRK